MSFYPNPESFWFNPETRWLNPKSCWPNLTPPDYILNLPGSTLSLSDKILSLSDWITRHADSIPSFQSSWPNPESSWLIPESFWLDFAFGLGSWQIWDARKRWPPPSPARLQLKIALCELVWGLCVVIWSVVFVGESNCLNFENIYSEGRCILLTDFFLSCWQACGHVRQQKTSAWEITIFRTKSNVDKVPNKLDKVPPEMNDVISCRK